MSSVTLEPTTTTDNAVPLNHRQFPELEPTKASLKRLHQQQLSHHGPSPKTQQIAIMDVLGGFDQILIQLLASDAFIDQNQLNSLHQIIDNPQHYIQIPLQTQSKIIQNLVHNEDKGFEQSITYTFNDGDILLFSLLQKQTAIKIRKILSK